jgi:hypothetical protein
MVGVYRYSILYSSFGLALDTLPSYVFAWSEWNVVVAE